MSSDFSTKPLPESDSSTPIAPLAPKQHVTAALDNELNIRAGLARKGNRAIRNDLYFTFLAKITTVCRLVRRTSGRALGVELEDIEQEAFIVFCEVVDSWSGMGSFTAYLTATFRFRLQDHVRVLGDRRRQESSSGIPERHATQSSLGDDPIALLEELCESMDQFKATIVLFRVRDGLSTSEIARRLGVNRRTVQRAWRVAQDQISRSLFSKR